MQLVDPLVLDMSLVTYSKPMDGRQCIKVLQCCALLLRHLVVTLHCLTKHIVVKIEK